MNNIQLSVGDGTITGAISALNTDLAQEYTSVSKNSVTDGAIRLWRQGVVKRIKLSGTIKPTFTVGTAITIATLPEKFRPSYDYAKNIVYRAENNIVAIGRLNINVDGSVTFIPYTVPASGGVFYMDEIFL